jgi:5-methylcytosine-specific restriction endonuclease McrA
MTLMDEMLNYERPTGLSASAKAALEQARVALEQARATKSPRPDDVTAKAARSERRIKSFYNGWPWKKLRYQVLRDRGRTCECCHASAADGAKIVVDHVRPLRHFWHLRLDAKNMQVLCDSCNRGKGSDDHTDWRETPETDNPVAINTSM